VETRVEPLILESVPAGLLTGHFCFAQKGLICELSYRKLDVVAGGSGFGFGAAFAGPEQGRRPGSSSHGSVDEP
jgi:hypothetical protein